MQHIFGGPGRVVFAATAATKLVYFVVKCSFFVFHSHLRRLGSRVVSVLDSGAEGPGFKSQSGNSLKQTVHCASVHLAAKLVAALLRIAWVNAGLAENNGSLPSGL